MRARLFRRSLVVLLLWVFMVVDLASPQPAPLVEMDQPVQQPMKPEPPVPTLEKPEISVRTDKGIYRSGERPKVSGRLFSGTRIGTIRYARVQIYEEVQRDAAQEEQGGDSTRSSIANWAVKYNNIVEAQGATFTDDGYVAQMPHKGMLTQLSTMRTRYRVEAEGLTDTLYTPRATTEFIVEEVGLLQIGLLMAYAVLAWLGILVMVYYTVIQTPTKRAARKMLIMTYIMVLLFLGLPLLGPLLISFFTDLEVLLRTTPVGLLKGPLEEPEVIQWIINIGGVLSTGGKLNGGIAIPLFVPLLAMLGAAINTLRKLPDFLRQYGQIPDQETREGREQTLPSSRTGEELRSDLFRYFVYLLSSPFIGMIAYSLMFIVNYTNPHALAIVAFASGFISDSVVEELIARARSIIDSSRRGQQASGTGDTPPRGGS